MKGALLASRISRSFPPEATSEEPGLRTYPSPPGVPRSIRFASVLRPLLWSKVLDFAVLCITPERERRTAAIFFCSPTSGDNHGRAVNLILFQSRKRFIHILQGKGRNFRTQAYLAREFQEFSGVLPCHVGNTANLSLAPKK